MKVLLANIFYNQESTGKIIISTKSFLESQGISTVVAYGVKGNDSEANVHYFGNKIERKICHLLNRIGRQQYRGSLFATFKLIHLIKQEQPDIVHLHCMNGYSINLYRLLRFLSFSNINTVVTHHAEFYYTGVCSYAQECMEWASNTCKKCPRPKKVTNSMFLTNTERDWHDMKQAFSGFSKDKIIFTCVSPWVQSRASQSPIVNQFRHVSVNNGIDGSFFRYVPHTTIIEKRFGLLSSKIILFVTSQFIPCDISHIKGGWFVIEIAKRHPELSFVIVAGHCGEIGEIPANVHMWGRTNNAQELASLYSSADITLLPSRRETFSMVTAESLCCGTPVIGFLAGGPESIALPEYSKFVEYGNTNLLETALLNMLLNNIDKQKLSEIAITEYSETTMAQRYLEVYRSFPQ